MDYNQDTIDIILSNAVALDDDGWALIAPFGEHPKERMASVAGRMVRQKFIQVLDNDSADDLLSKENSLFRRIKRAVVGIPVYNGHPDLADHSPETLGNSRARKNVIGVVDAVRKGAGGIDAHFNLTPDGATAVENGSKYPSALWLVLPNGQRGDATVVKPFKLLSVGLTDRPNISGVESLANARGAEMAQQKEPDMKLIAGWLRAQGITLENCEAPTETQVLNAVQTLFTDQAGRVTTLGNEKTQTAGQITTLTTERDAAKGQVTALTNERDGFKTKFETERKTRATAVVDLAIARGKLAVADRAARIETLANSADFDKDAAAMVDPGKANVIKLSAVLDKNTDKALANEGTANTDPRDEYASAVSDHLKLNPDCGPVQAHNAVMKKYPTLADKLKGRDAASASK